MEKQFPIQYTLDSKYNLEHALQHQTHNYTWYTHVEKKRVGSCPNLVIKNSNAPADSSFNLCTSNHTHHTHTHTLIILKLMRRHNVCVELNWLPFDINTYAGIWLLVFSSFFLFIFDNMLQKVVHLQLYIWHCNIDASFPWIILSLSHLTFVRIGNFLDW